MPLPGADFVLPPGSAAPQWELAVEAPGLRGERVSSPEGLTFQVYG
ncbi:hypothetical protein [Lentzea flaviverrucosa]|nr:hypothetical protein [Lentzea flaviverrucosa]